MPETDGGSADSADLMSVQSAVLFGDKDMGADEFRGFFRIGFEERVGSDGVRQRAVEQADGDVASEADFGGRDDFEHGASVRFAFPVVKDDWAAELALVMICHDDVSWRDGGDGGAVVPADSGQVELPRPSLVPPDRAVGIVGLEDV